MSETLDPIWKHLKPNYKLLKIVGQGTFGTVVQAMHRKTGIEVAIKLIKT
jgi:serine/threonine protein kinase